MSSEDFHGGKSSLPDYVPESWIFSKVEVEQLEEEMESITRLDDIIRHTAAFSLLQSIFQVLEIVRTALSQSRRNSAS